LRIFLRNSGGRFGRKKQHSGEKGGGDESGAYEVVDGWLKPPNPEGWVPGPTIINSGIIIGPMGGQFYPTPEMARDHNIVYPEYLDADTRDEIVKAVKAFGVKSEDIKTQNNSIYQMQEYYYDNGTQKSRPGQWSVNNSIEIILREVDRAAALADLLSKSGANNVNGPSFMMDNTTTFEASLAAEAIADARKKAEAMASSSGAKLGEVVTVVEGYNATPVYPLSMMGRGGGGGAVVEPGSATVGKTVTVTFRLE